MVAGAHSAPRALVIEPDPQCASDLEDALRRFGIECMVVRDAESGWQAFARYRATHVVAALRTPREGGDWFLRRLQGEYLGAMPKVFLTCSEADLENDLPTEPDAFIITPIAERALQSLFEEPAFQDSPARQAARLRELYELSLIGPELLQALDMLVARASLAFQASDCIVWGPPSEPHWPRASRPLGDDEVELILNRCNLALGARTSVIVSSVPPSGAAICGGPGQTLLAAPLGPPGDQPLASICLVSADARTFTGEERDCLRVLARRLSSELAWMSAHNRLVVEHEKLRQAALLDPLLGVWTRSALEQTIESQLSAPGRGNLTLGVFDIKHLRGVNDRHGHLVGDAVLAHFASTVNRCVRPQDHVGRIGGDELAVLFVGAEVDEAMRHAEAIVGEIDRSPYQEDDLSIPLEVYAGVTTLSPAELHGGQAFARALAASQSARRGGERVGDGDERRDGDRSAVALASQSLPTGSTLGGMYRILHEISRGAMGVVYRGEDLGLGRQVAIKVLRSDLASDVELVSKFRAEAALLASLRHRNLVQVYSFGSEGEDVYFVMELVEGEPLSKTVGRQLQQVEIGYEALAKIIEEIAEALDAIHNVGIVHRDVKPDNILVDRINDRAVLVDVGIARRQDDARDAAGTPGYAAPECFMEADETPATDVYGLAATTYAMLTGRAPYSGEELVQVVSQQLNEPPTPPSQLCPDLSPAVDSVLLTALAGDQQSRYRTASAFAIALTRALVRPDARPAKRGRQTIVPEEKPEQPPPATPPRPPTARRLDTQREHPSTYRLAAPVRGDQAGGSEFGHCRGAVFRVAAVTLGHHLGASWVDAVADADPHVAELLRPTLAATSWHPVEHLIWLLRCMEGYSEQTGRTSAELARDIGSTVISATLAQFFGADPSSHSAASLLKAGEAYWKRYFSWSDLQMTAATAGSARIDLTRSPGDPLLCALVCGMLGQVALMSGAAAGDCRHTTCVGRDQASCQFEVSWQ